MTPADFRTTVELLNYRLGYTLTDEQRAYADHHILPHLSYWHSNKKVVCMDCGKMFSSSQLGCEKQLVELPLPQPTVVKDGDTIVCPHCGAELEVKHCRKTTIDDYITMAVEETVNGIKVKRVFEAYYYKSIRYERHFTEQHRVSWSEVMRIWTDPENPQNREVGTASLNLMNYSCRSPWAHSSSVVIRRPSSPGTNRYYIEQDYEGVEEIPVYCDRHIDISYQHTTLQAIQAELKGRIILHRCVERIFEVPMIESLVKAGRTKMAAFIANASFGKKYRYNHDARCTISVHLSDYITAAKICIRNDYHPDDLIVFFDYIDNLVFDRKDIHNAHYVCAPDLLAAHTVLLERQRREHERELARQRAEREERDRRWHEELARRDAEWRRAHAAEIAERERRAAMTEEQRMAEDNEKYQRDKKMYLGIAFGEDKEHLQFHVLGSIEEFQDEGKHMHHCVYSNGYYRNADSLILSCRDKNGKRVATIEINLRDFSIVQTRAACNAVPPQLKLINETVKQHMDEFRQAKAAQMALTAPTAEDEDEELDYCPAAVVI